MVRLDGLGKLNKISITLSRLEPSTFRLVAYCLNYLHYCVPIKLIESGGKELWECMVALCVVH
jgi:hypothetical protein